MEKIMSFIQSNKIILDIGLSKEYKLIHFSDVHVVTYDSNDEIEEIHKAIKSEEAWFKVRKDFADYFNELYLDIHMIPSRECLKKLIQYSNSVAPDIVLLTGDIIDYYSNANYNFLKKELDKLISPYLFSCGNHESPASLYDNICRGNGEISYHEFEEFMIVSLDNSKKNISEKQINILKSILDLGKPIIISMHIPIMTKYNEEQMKKYDPYFIINYKDTDEITLRFIELIISSKQIKAIFCGHTHGASFSYFGIDKPQYCASSGLIGYVNNIIVK